MKKIIALVVLSFFALNLGAVYAQEGTQKNPWEQNQPTKTPAKKEDKTRKNAKKTTVKKAKNTNKAKAKKSTTAKAEKKEPEQKKKYIFW